MFCMMNKKMDMPLEHRRFTTEGNKHLSVHFYTSLIFVHVHLSRYFLFFSKRLSAFFKLTLKVRITTAADDKFLDIYPNFRQK